MMNLPYDTKDENENILRANNLLDDRLKLGAFVKKKKSLPV